MLHFAIRMCKKGRVCKVEQMIGSPRASIFAKKFCTTIAVRCLATVFKTLVLVSPSKIQVKRSYPGL